MEVEEIPEHVEGLGRATYYDLKTATGHLLKTLEAIEDSGTDYKLVLSMLKKVRLELNKSDLIISDLQAILQGLHNYHNGEEHVSEGRPIMDPSRDTITETEDTGEG
jgi:hypothetical protein